MSRIVKLPAGYRQVEYIESTGTQYIPSVTVSQNFKFEMRLRAKTTAQYMNLYDTPTFAPPMLWIDTDKRLEMNIAKSSCVLTDEIAHIVSDATGDENLLTVNGTVVQTSAKIVGNSFEITLFNRAGAQCFVGKLYSLKIYDNGALIRDYIPCKTSDNVGGLYDRVEGKFYGNAGTGAFLYGPPVVLPKGYRRLTHIQSSGTQYVDTLFVPTSNTKIECDFQRMNTTAQYSGVYISGSYFAFGGGNNIELYYGNKYVSAAFPTGRTTITIDGVSKTASIGGTTYTFSSPSYTAGTNSLIIFALKRSATNIADYCYMRLYGYRVYDNGTLVRDFAPCVTDGGEVGLYDDLNGVFYGNAGTGTFTAGPYIDYDEVFANNDWSTIIKACQKNEVPSDWAIGDQKPMSINGVDYLIDIIGKHHDAYADGSGTAPLTLQMHDCYNTGYKMNGSATNAGGWKDSYMRLTCLPENFFANLPAEVQAGIKEVNKLTSAGNQSATIDTTADKLFLLSEIEIFGSLTNSKAGEGSQYAYYSAGNSKVKKLNGSANGYWTRSPNGNYSTAFCFVRDSGAASGNNANTIYGVAFAFCFGGVYEGEDEQLDSPTDLAASTNTDNTITLSWSEVEDALGYRVYRNAVLRAELSETVFTDDITPFEYTAFAVTAFNDLGESDPASLEVNYFPENPVLHLITDRTYADVSRADQLNALWVGGVFTGTTEELAEWFGNLKGAYNASDFNRVGAAVQYVANRMSAQGYIASASMKTDWTAADIPTPTQTADYLAAVRNLRKVITVLPTTPEAPTDIEGFNYGEANAIEQILVDLDMLLTKISLAWVYSGEMYSGEV